MTKKQPAQSEMTALRTLRIAGVPLTHVHVSDRYHHLKYWPERRVIRSLTDFMEWYLRHHPEVDAHSSKNLSRALIYMNPGMRVWREYVPGGFATYHVHSPHKRRLPAGKKTDLITRALFRHSFDAEGLRSRAVIMAQLASEAVQRVPAGAIEWMSIAAGSGQPVYDACRRLSVKDQRRVALTLTDVSSDMLAFAERLYEAEELKLGSITFELSNVTKGTERRTLLGGKRPMVIDIMGLFEYLTDKQCIKILRALHASLAPTGVIIFTNMSPGHPHLHVHQRGLGWPGVIQRTIHEVITLVEAAGIARSKQRVFRAEDNVYNVYEVSK